VWTGQELFNFSRPPNGSTAYPPTDPRWKLDAPVAGSIGPLAFGPSSRADAAFPANGGYFDTATFGDANGALWTLRFSNPGSIGANGQATNWFGGRSFQFARSSASALCAGRQPFFYVTANVPLYSSNRMLRVLAGTGQRFLDRLPHHEMRPQQPHRLSRSRAHRGKSKSLEKRIEDALGRLFRLNDASSNAERPRRGRNQQRMRLAVVRGPVSACELVLDQTIGGCRIRHPQQRLRKHHEGKTFASGQRIGMQEVLDSSESAGACPDAGDQAAGVGINPAFHGSRANCSIEKLGGNRFIGGRIGRAKPRCEIELMG